MNYFFLFSFLFLVLLATNAFALGLGVTPAHLEFSINSKEDLEEEFFVINNDKEKLRFNVYSDSNAINLFPTDFVLEAGENREVLVKINPELLGADFNATIFIVSSEAEKTDIRTGIKIPVIVKLLNRERIEGFEEERIIEEKEEGKEKTRNEETPLTGFFPLASSQIILGIIIIALAVLTAIFLRKRKNYKISE